MVGPNQPDKPEYRPWYNSSLFRNLGYYGGLALLFGTIIVAGGDCQRRADRLKVELEQQAALMSKVQEKNATGDEGIDRFVEIGTEKFFSHVDGQRVEDRVR